MCVVIVPPRVPWAGRSPQVDCHDCGRLGRLGGGGGGEGGGGWRGQWRGIECSNAERDPRDGPGPHRAASDSSGPLVGSLWLVSHMDGVHGILRSLKLNPSPAPAVPE